MKISVLYSLEQTSCPFYKSSMLVSQLFEQRVFLTFNFTSDLFANVLVFAKIVLHLVSLFF